MYELSRLAAEDFAAIFEYTLLNFGKAQAEEYQQGLETVLTLLSEQPRMGFACPAVLDGLYCHPHKKHNIFYRQQPGGVFVLRLLHQRSVLPKHRLMED